MRSCLSTSLKFKYLLWNVFPFLCLNWCWQGTNNITLVSVYGWDKIFPTIIQMRFSQPIVDNISFIFLTTFLSKKCYFIISTNHTKLVPPIGWYLDIRKISQHVAGTKERIGPTTDVHPPSKMIPTLPLLNKFINHNRIWAQNLTVAMSEIRQYHVGYLTTSNFTVVSGIKSDIQRK